jgi:uncharacterized membrane protein (UPF0127 family)
MRTLFFGIGLLIIFAGFSLEVFHRYEVKKEVVPEPLVPTGILIINDTAIAVAVADTESARVRGLSGQPFIREEEGLLFVFPDSKKHGIWMRGMQFPIDIIWFDENFRIIDVYRNATPESYPSVFTPSLDARYILEVSAGFSAQSGISIGDNAHFVPVTSAF